MTRDHCESQIARLSVLRGLPEDVTEYFGALSDIPELVFVEAVGHALRTRAWFPTPAELRADCDVAAAKFQVLEPDEPHIEAAVGGGRTVTIQNPFGGHPITVHVAREWRFDCDDCTDTGWRSRQCPAEPCGRRGEHDPHEWVDPCACRDWNPTIRRRKQAGAKYSQPSEKVA
jgi:hypothetical protein